MSQQLISRSADLTALRNKGYNVTVTGAHLVIADVPYVDLQGNVQRGSLVSELTLSGDATTRPANHVVYFTGEHPCDRNGQPLQHLVNSSTRQDLGNGIVATHMFSSKPKTGYTDYEHKMSTYITILSGPAEALEPGATARTFPVVAPDDETSPFAYLDTASSRVGIGVINEHLTGHKLAVVGVGGTGSYIVDLVVKSPVAEIHLWDGDQLLQHNAFRAPGAVSRETLRAAPNKADYYADAYGSMHRGIYSHPNYIDEDNVDDLCDMDFVFIAIGDGDAKKIVITRLLEHGVPFIDVGVGVYEVNGSLGGSVRVTTSSALKNDHIEQRIPMVGADAEDMYGTNIQLADLNCLNAALAVTRWKRHTGFYNDLEGEHHAIFDIDGNSITNDDHT